MDLDYHNGCTQEFIRDACLYWIDSFGIDGIRFDNTTNFYLETDLSHGLPRLVADINTHVTQIGRLPFATILEHLDITAAHVTQTVGATSYWNNALYERAFDTLWNGRIDTRLLGALNNHVGLTANQVATTYLSNHDHSHVTWQSGARKNGGFQQAYRVQPWLIALLTSPGSPLIHSGVEFAEDHWIPEDDLGTGRRVEARPLHWKRPDDEIGRWYVSLHQQLISLRQQHPALRSDNFYPGPEAEKYRCFTPDGYGVHEDWGIAIYHRWGLNDQQTLERFIIALNFTDQDRQVDIPMSADGWWQEMLENQPVQVFNGRLSGQNIPSNWGRIYFRLGN